jgi:hypothetical protein
MQGLLIFDMVAHNQLLCSVICSSLLTSPSLGIEAISHIVVKNAHLEHVNKCKYRMEHHVTGSID